MRKKTKISIIAVFVILASVVVWRFSLAIGLENSSGSGNIKAAEKYLKLGAIPNDESNGVPWIVVLVEDDKSDVGSYSQKWYRLGRSTRFKRETEGFCSVQREARCF